MGKKKSSSSSTNSSSTDTSKYPFVSVCTPTFNRRPFGLWLSNVLKNMIIPKTNGMDYC